MKNFTTPKGAAGYSNLTKPDTKFDAEGKYKTSITLPTEQAESLMELAREEANELAVLDKKTKKVVMPEGIKYPFVENDDDTVTFTFKGKKKPKLFDAKGNPILGQAAEDLRVGGGSTIKVKGAFSAYEGFGGGVTAYLNDVQIIKLVEFGGGGFKAEDDEDGYVAGASAPAERFDDEGTQEEGVPSEGPVDF